MSSNRNQIIFSIFILLLFTGCDNNRGVVLPKRRLEEVGAIDDKSFQAFWKDFRQAVLDDGMEKLIQLTQFKLEVEGENDSDPTVLYSENEFPTVFHAYLEQMSGEKGKQIEKEIDLIQRTQSPYIYRHDFAKVGGMEFAKTNGKWKLTTVRLTESSMKEVNEALNDIEEK